MTDIERKAREVAHGIVSDWLKDDSGTEIEQRDKLVGNIAAAIQSAVDDERLENRKLFSIGMSDLRRESNYDRICDKVRQIDEAIRARAQAKEKP